MVLSLCCCEPVNDIIWKLFAGSCCRGQRAANCVANLWVKCLAGLVITAQHSKALCSAPGDILDEGSLKHFLQWLRYSRLVGFSKPLSSAAIVVVAFSWCWNFVTTLSIKIFGIFLWLLSTFSIDCEWDRAQRPSYNIRRECPHCTAPLLCGTEYLAETIKQ